MSEEKGKISAENALQLCQKFLGGAWNQIDVNRFQINPISGGLSNYLYCCSLTEDLPTLNNEPRQILLRIYGETHRKHRSTLLIDSVVCTLLSERKLGPHVYGIFPDGRLEQLVQAESLHVKQIRDEKTSRKLAKLLGELHRIEMPLVKEPIWLFTTIERFLNDLPEDVKHFQNDRDREIFDELRSVCDFREEYKKLREILSSVESPVCFTHNDFQPGNILCLNDEPENFTVIDFEYCSYNFRGFDIGNHFCEFMFDYKSSKEWPFFDVRFDFYPNENQQLNFLRSYVDEILSDKSDDVSPIDRDQLVRQIMKEANTFALASNFMWTLWSIHMATSTSIPFGYMEYGRARLTAFYLMRHLIIETDQQLPPRLNDEILRSPLNPFHKSYFLSSPERKD